MARRPMTDAQRKAHAAAQVRWREEHMDSDKEKLTLVLNAGTKERLHRIAAHYGYRSLTKFIEWLVGTADRDIIEEKERAAKEETIRRVRKKSHV